VRVRVDRERCLGHGLCEAFAGDIYQITDMGFNEMGEFEVAEGLRGAAKRGASACPERAITLLDDTTHRTETKGAAMPETASATSSVRTTREVVDQIIQYMLDIDMAGFGDLWTEDGVVELLFAPQGAPRALRGRDTIREYLIKGQAATPLKLEKIEDLVVHETADPEVVVFEFVGIGSVSTTGGTYRTTYIDVLRARDGQIVSLRHFAEPTAWLIAASETKGESA
jgi:ketosteroid isomerase-like protein/ferredoxin